MPVKPFKRGPILEALGLKKGDGHWTERKQSAADAAASAYAQFKAIPVRLKPAKNPRTAPRSGYSRLTVPAKEPSLRGRYLTLERAAYLPINGEQTTAIKIGSSRLPDAKSRLADLPADAFKLVLDYLSPSDLARLSVTSRDFLNAVETHHPHIETTLSSGALMEELRQRPHSRGQTRWFVNDLAREQVVDKARSLSVHEKEELEAVAIESLDQLDHSNDLGFRAASILGTVAMALGSHTGDSVNARHLVDSVALYLSRVSWSGIWFDDPGSRVPRAQLLAAFINECAELGPDMLQSADELARDNARVSAFQLIQSVAPVSTFGGIRSRKPSQAAFEFACTAGLAQLSSAGGRGAQAVEDVAVALARTLVSMPADRGEFDASTARRRLIDGIHAALTPWGQQEIDSFVVSLRLDILDIRRSLSDVDLVAWNLAFDPPP